MLLAAIGDDALLVFNIFTFTDAVHKRKLNEVKKRIKEYCSPRKNVIMERHMFWKTTQAHDETIDSFVTSLRHRAKSWEFGTQEKSLIRDRLVLGCLDKRQQEKLLCETGLTL